MNSQTVRRPDNKRSTRSTKSNKPKPRYSKQTARFEGKRDGKPLIFGWGGHLSHKEKEQFQRRATWGAAIAVALIIVFVLVGFWVNFNIIVPNLSITSVNGHSIPQSLYRKMVAFKTELAEEQLSGPNGLTAESDSLRKVVANDQKAVDDTTSKITTLNTELKALKPGSSTQAQRTQLNSQIKTLGTQLSKEDATLNTDTGKATDFTQNVIPNAQQIFDQPQIANDSIAWLQNDELIREWLATQSSSVQAKVNPTSSAVAKAMADFKANIPKTSSYNAFLNRDGVSDGDMQDIMTIYLRRSNMQSYLVSQIVSPTYQVLAREMTIDTMAHAKQFLTQLKNGADFGKLAKASSLDTRTAPSGGFLGWLARGQYAQTYNSGIIENWLFSPARYINELGPVFVENGTFRIIQVLGIDPAHAIDATTLQALKTNALTNWLLEQQALPSNNITPADQNMLLDTANMPPDLPLTAPGGGPSSVPGGQPPAQP
jgi:PPIC-type PPIASE domain